MSEDTKQVDEQIIPTIDFDFSDASEEVIEEIAGDDVPKEVDKPDKTASEDKDGNQPDEVGERLKAR